MNPLGVDQTFCLSLDKRREHWEDLQNECARRGWSFYPFIVGDGKDETLSYDYVDEKFPNINSWGYGASYNQKKRHFNAFLSHQSIIRKAKKAGYKSILLLEDDVYITDRFDKIIERLAFDTVPTSVYDLFYLGWWIGEHKNDMHAGWNLEVEKNWEENEWYGVSKVQQLGGLHAVYINSTMYDLLLSLSPICPIDSQLNMLHHSIKSYFVYPKIIHVKSMYSSCEDRFVTRDAIS